MHFVTNFENREPKILHHDSENLVTERENLGTERENVNYDNFESTRRT